ncbi:hypothetical protein SAMN04489719_2129 [Agrococcus carbonis]|uniref:Uncharacterized protein n=2 Tax=Agrococcus carbonis TaxID=684552 RepID=A0A1H1RIE6_9MICO|nr:hypothetical protein SAMN04489719_2129 [Agrococcus carbonis]
MIVGSCVSRDALSHVAADFSVESYIARQSLISAGSPVAASPLHAERIPSSFQRRSMQSDHQGDLFDQVSHRADVVDLVLWDIVDERNGVVRSPDGHYFTNNWELHQTGAVDALPELPVVAFDTEEHFELWRRGAERFVALLRAKELFDRTIAILPAMADRFEDGTKVSSVSPRFNDGYGERFERYVKFIGEELGIVTVALPISEVRAGRRHRWGVAPYHYDDRTEALIAEAIRRVADENRWPSSGHLPTYWSVPPLNGSLELRVHASQATSPSGFLVEAHALDAAGDVLSPSTLSWPFSRHVGSAYCYVPSTTGPAAIDLLPLAASADVRSVLLRPRNWNDQSASAERVISSIEVKSSDSWKLLTLRRAPEALAMSDL